MMKLWMMILISCKVKESGSQQLSRESGELGREREGAGSETLVTERRGGRGGRRDAPIFDI